MLGPNIDRLANNIEGSISYVFFKEEFPTVGTLVYREKGEATALNISNLFA